MNPDYLDLLLDRATGSIPLVEPRLTTTLVGLPVVPQLEEIAEDIVQPAISPQRKQPGESQTNPLTSVPRAVVGQAVDKPVREEMMPLQVSSVPKEAFITIAPSPANVAKPAIHRSIGASPERQTHLSTDPANLSTDLAEPSVLRSAASIVEAATFAMEPSEVVERTMQTQRWFPPPSRDQALEIHPALQTRQAAQTPFSAVTSNQPFVAPLAPVHGQSPSPISIRIDRIEVRAGGSVTGAPSTRRPRAAVPLGLDEYLRRKNGGVQ